MARVKDPLLKKLERVLTRRFPPPATIRLEDQHGIIGIVTSAGFARMDPIDRQELIGEILSESLTPDERHRVQAIVAVTPDEETGYLAVAE
jgi:acid stress-induced BolA-like protein IbaG/YrbA